MARCRWFEEDLRSEVCFEVQTTGLSRFQAWLRSCALSQSSSASYLFFIQQGIWILNTVSSSSVYQLRSPCMLLSLFL